MLTLQRLGSDHAAAVLKFERLNRDYFAASIADRGDEFFDEFFERFAQLLEEQATETCIFHVLINDEDEVVGRFNLYRVDGPTAEVGYRVAQLVAGHGVATSTLRELCQLAAQRYGIGTLTAAVHDENVASRRVLEKVGFVPVGPTHVAGRPGTKYEITTEGTSRP